MREQTLSVSQGEPSWKMENGTAVNALALDSGGGDGTFEERTGMDGVWREFKGLWHPC